MKLKQSYALTLVLTVPIVLVLLVFVYMYKAPINLLSNSQYSFTTFSDSLDHFVEGRSKCFITKKPESIGVYTDLNEGYKYPYAGIIIKPIPQQLIDLRFYTIDLTITSQQEFRLPIRLTLDLPGFTKPQEPTSYLFLIETYPISVGENNFQIPVSNFDEVPQWWYTENNISEKDLKSFSFKHTQGISFFSDPSYPLNKNIEYTITHLNLKFNYIPFVTWAGIGLVIYYLLLGLLWKYSRLKNNLVFIPIEATQVGQAPNHSGMILNYIGQQYSNADLKIKDVAMHVGISENQVSEILKQYCKLGFKQYLNQIRLEEAKRLLKNSDLQISEIAFKVGYNNVTHFNRTFKEVENISPTAFKEK